MEEQVKIMTEEIEEQAKKVVEEMEALWWENETLGLKASSLGTREERRKGAKHQRS